MKNDKSRTLTEKREAAPFETASFVSPDECVKQNLYLKDYRM